MSCYNPGEDLVNVECPKKEKCDKDYDKFCGYNTQGQYICDKTQNFDSKKEMGLSYVLGKPYLNALYEKSIVYDKKSHS